MPYSSAFARKVIQAKMFGLWAVPIQRKLDSDWSAQRTMLVEEDWNARCKIAEQVLGYLEKNAGDESWFPLLYNWEVRPFSC